MLLLLDILLVLFLGLIFWEDFKFRLVNILYFPAILVIAFVVFILENGVYNNIVFSLIFVFLNLICIKIYTTLKSKHFNGVFFKIPGLAEGDIFLFFAIIPVFSFVNYVLFFITGLFISLLIHLFILKFKIDKRETIPLAGYLSLYLGVLILFTQLLNRSFYININF